jgi:ankyrin repeat protein
MPHLRLTQPPALKSRSYQCGVEKLSGYDAWALFEAAASGDSVGAKALLAKDRRLVNAQYWYRFPLHFAVFAGQAEMVRLLLDGGANPGESVYTYDSWHKLLAAARLRGDAKIESLLTRAMQKRFGYNPEFEPLKDAIISRDKRKIAAALRRRPDLVRASDALGNNALHWAVITRQLELLPKLVELGTPLDAERADGLTPLLLAVSGASDYWYRATRARSHPTLRNTWVLVGSLLALGADYNISAATAAGDQERVEALLHRDESLARLRDSARISPLSYAASEGHLHIVRLLLERGADPNLPEDAAPQGRALYEACSHNHLAIAELLLAHGANPNAGVDSCECCLTIGRIYHGERAGPLEQLLRKHGAYTPPYRLSVAELKQAIRDDHEVTRHGEFESTVLAKQNRQLLELYLDSRRGAAKGLHFGGGAVWQGSAGMLRLLLERGLDPHQLDWLGKTLLHAAAECGDRSLATVLIGAGADINAVELEFQGTPLAAAVRAWCSETAAELLPRRRQMVRFLLERGASPKLPEEQAWATPLAWSKRGNCQEAIALLQEYGAA